MKTIGFEARMAALVDLIVGERRKAGLRQKDVAKKMKEYQSWVARLENGQRRIDVTEFFKLAKIIGFDPYKALRKLGF